MTPEDFAERLKRIQSRIEKSAHQAGRSHKEVVLVAVTKRQPVQAVEVARQWGLLDFGENYVQEAVDKRHAFSPQDCRWHLIGHLQSNKAGTAVESFDLIQSVDSVRLARQIAKQAEARNKVQKVLLQVHLGDEPTKTGFDPSGFAEAAQEIIDMSGIQIQGLMGIAPQDEDARPHFRFLKKLFDALPSSAQGILSMGMTADFEAAIEEGSTMVRIGSALFGERQLAETTAESI